MARFGVLYEHYKPGLVWYLAYQLSRRLVLVGVMFPIAAAGNQAALPVSLWLVCLAFLAVHLVARPYEHHWSNIFEVRAWPQSFLVMLDRSLNHHHRIHRPSGWCRW